MTNSMAMKTYLATEVRLMTPLGQNPLERTLLAKNVKSLRIAPESRQAFVEFNDGKCKVGLYENAEVPAEEFERMQRSHQCTVCGVLFENAQGLGNHTATQHRGGVPSVAKGKV